MAKHYRHKNIVRWRLRGRLLGVHRHLHYQRGEQDRRKKPDHAFALSKLRWSRTPGQRTYHAGAMGPMELSKPVPGASHNPLGRAAHEFSQVAATDDYRS